MKQGPLEESPVTGRLEPREAPVWQRRAFRYLVSFPIIGLCLVAVFIVMFLMLRLQVLIIHFVIFLKSWNNIIDKKKFITKKCSIKIKFCNK